MRYNIVSIIVLFYAFTLNSYADNYTIYQFFIDAKPEYITTEEDITKAQKEEIIRSKFMRGIDICSNNEWENDWYVAESNITFLKLKQCNGSAVEVHQYQYNKGGSVIAVVSVLGNQGQTQYYRFFRISQKNKIVNELTFNDLNISIIKENEFLPKNKQFSKEENHQAFFYIHRDGSIYVEPWTWMEARWADREPINEIWYEWNGSTFSRKMRENY